MKIIDFKKKGNVVRFYLGEDSLKDWGGDDWNDVPYEYNAEKVDDEYVAGYRDVVFPFDYEVVEPADECQNSQWRKDDMKRRRVPCIVALPNSEGLWEESFSKMNADSRAVRFYFGDKMEPSDKLEVFSLKWETCHQSDFTPGGDPCWRCPLCKGDEHVMGVETAGNKHSRCKKCGAKLVYNDSEE